MPARPQHELPPTAGLPLRFGDLLASGDDLAGIVAAQLGTPPLQLECSGTASLVVALLALRERAPQRKVVVVPAYTCPLVALAVRRAGLELRLCDLLPGHYDMDPQALEAACDERTLAIVPTHLAGRVADVGSAVRIARQVGAYVIEDAAQALGARQAGVSVGLAGDIGFFSLAAGKGLSIYEGGLLLTRDAELREQLQRSSVQHVPADFSWEARRSLELLGYALLYRPGGLGLAYGAPLRRALRRGDPVAAVGDDFSHDIPMHRVGRWRRTVGSQAAQRWPAFFEQCVAQAQRRIARLRKIDGIVVLDDPPGAQGSWPFFFVLLPDPQRRDAALARLWQSGLGVSRLFIHALPDYGYLADCVPAQDVPHARDFAARSLTISNSLWVSDAMFENVCSELEAALR